MNLPNLLSVSRLFLTPVFFAVFFLCHEAGGGAVAGVLWAKVAVLAIAVSFEVSDVLDGFLARRWGQTTSLGKVIDPLSDSFSRFTVFVCFLWAGYAGLWMVLLIFWRDCLVAGLRGIAAREGIAMGARLTGKLKAIVQGSVILGVSLLDVLQTTHWPDLDVVGLAGWAMTAVAIVTTLSLVDYVVGSLPLLRRVFAE